MYKQQAFVHLLCSAACLQLAAVFHSLATTGTADRMADSLANTGTANSCGVLAQFLVHSFAGSLVSKHDFGFELYSGVIQGLFQGGAVAPRPSHSLPAHCLSEFEA